MVTVHAVLWWNAREGLRAGNQDFTAFYTAGTMISRGEGAQLYDGGLQYQTQREFAPQIGISRPLRYIHPPVEAVIFVPLAHLPYFQAYLVWVLLNLIVLAPALLLLPPRHTGLRTQPVLLKLLAGLGFFPVFLALLQGQDILLLLLLYALAWSAMKRHSDFTAGCLLGLGLFRFHLVLPFLLVQALHRKWRLLGGSAAVAMLMVLLSAAVVGWKEAVAYPAYLLSLANHLGAGVNTPQHMPNLCGLLFALLPSGPSHRLWLPLVAVCSLAILWYTARLWRSTGNDPVFSLRFSLAVIATLLASYHAYDYDLSLALIPTLLLLDYLQAHPTPRSTKWLLLAPAFLLFLTPLHIVLIYRWKYACLFSIVLLLWFWAIAREMLRPRAISHAYQ